MNIEAITRSLALVLLHSIWQGALLALLLFTLLRALDRQGPRARYGAACLTLLAILLLPVGTVLLTELPASAERPLPRISTGAEPAALGAALPIAGAPSGTAGSEGWLLRSLALYETSLARRRRPLALRRPRAVAAPSTGLAASARAHTNGFRGRTGHSGDGPAPGFAARHPPPP